MGCDNLTGFFYIQRFEGFCTPIEGKMLPPTDMLADKKAKIHQRVFDASQHKEVILKHRPAQRCPVASLWAVVRFTMKPCEQCRTRMSDFSRVSLPCMRWEQRDLFR